MLALDWRVGESVAKYIRHTSPYNTQIVALGIDTYLKMLLHDNFVVSWQLSLQDVCTVPYPRGCLQRPDHGLRVGHESSPLTMPAGPDMVHPVACQKPHEQDIMQLGFLPMSRWSIWPTAATVVCSTLICTRATSWCGCGPAGRTGMGRRTRSPTSTTCCCGPSQRGRLAPSCSW